MKVNSVAMNNCCGFKNPNFKANFINNELSDDLIKFSSKEDVDEFKKVCEELESAKKDRLSYWLSGVTSGYGVCCESEIDDKFVTLACGFGRNTVPNSVRSWIIKNESIVSGGCEKKNLLKEITKTLKNIASSDVARTSKYDFKTIVLKKATFK